MRAPPVRQDAAPEVQGPRAASFSRSVVLIMAANGAMALYQWGVIVATARIASPRDLGALTLGLAIAAPLLTLSTTGLRLVQIRDVGLEASGARYVRARVMAVAASLAVIAPLTLLFHLDGRELVIAALVVLVRGSEAIADACWAFLLAVTAISDLVRVLFVRATASVVVFTLALVITGRTAAALVALTIVSLSLIFAVELPRLRAGERHHASELGPDRGPSPARIAMVALPLGVASALTSLNVSVPRYVLQHERGIDAVAVFSAMATVFAVVSLFTAAVGQTAIPRLARWIRAGRRDEFVRLLGHMLTLGAIAGGATFVVGAIGGRSILRWVYGPLFATELLAFRWLLAALAVMCLVTFLQDGLTVLDRKGAQVVGFGLGTLVTAVLCVRWVPGGGTTAAAQALCAGAIAQLAFFGAAVVLACRRHA